MRITAAVAREEGQPFTIEELELGELRPDEVLVGIRAAGLCRTDVAVRDQWVTAPLPAVLGHEGAGTVLTAGAKVTCVRPGDTVVLTFASCGECALCSSGHPAYCLESVALNLGGGRADGSNTLRSDVRGCFFGQSSFATHAIAHESTVVKIDPDVAPTVAAPLGCGALAGAGTVINRLRPAAGSSIAVFGVGAVGMAALMAARAAGCGTIIAVDVHPDRLDLALSLGATHVIDTTRVNPISTILRITGVGVANAVDTTGVPEITRQAADSLAPLGTCAVLGVGPFGTELSVDVTNLLIPGRTVTGVAKGDARPHELIPRLLDLHRQGLFPIDRLVNAYALADINRAIEDVESGKCVQAVLMPY